jgi:hypothetical protein
MSTRNFNKIDEKMSKSNFNFANLDFIPAPSSYNASPQDYKSAKIGQVLNSSVSHSEK